MNGNWKRKPGLTTHALAPENQESPIHFLWYWKTPEEYVYRRNHFPYPLLSRQAFQLPVVGEVLAPTRFQYEDLQAMPHQTLVMTMECAGNRRANFRPEVFGEQWKDGAISQGEWKGVSLAALLSITGIRPTAKEVVFEGYDYGSSAASIAKAPFARSLPLQKALHPDTIIAYEYNGKPIPFAHGYPLRLIVPQWYGMASVKWLRAIRVIDHEFTGYFQAVDYNYYPREETDEGKQPVTTMKVNSIIQQPMDMAVLKAGLLQIEGIAWTGTGRIVKLEVSIDGGSEWEPARLWVDAGQPYSLAYWSYNWPAERKGEYTIYSRAVDSAGHMQPMETAWNRKGYGYNAAYQIRVKVE